MSAGVGPIERRVYMLGGFRVGIGPAIVPDRSWRRRKAAAVIKQLALAPGHRLHREQIMDALWPELDPRAAGANLRKVVHHARAALDGACPGAGDMIVTAGDSLALAAGVEVDVDQFRSTLAGARRAGDIDAYRRALDLYQGELLPEDLYEEWAVAARRELHIDFLAGLTELAALLEACGDAAAATHAVRRLVTADPTGEDANASLIRLYALAGRRADALRHYDHFRQLLDQELGTEPGPATQRICEELRIAGPAASTRLGGCGRGRAARRRCRAVRPAHDARS
jgi:DNA-binding SARP family transcriptional activator